MLNRVNQWQQQKVVKASFPFPRTFIFVLLVLMLRSSSAASGIKCSTTTECVKKLRIGSICDSNGFCTNPLMKGCLHHEFEHATFLGKEGQSHNNNKKGSIQKFVESKRRVCNSDDPPDAEEKNICEKPNPILNYTEIRIASGDWDSSMFLGWIMQILLSEVLLVPAIIENSSNQSASFYDEYNLFEFGTDYLWDALSKANELNGDCSQSNATEVCAHIMPEVWRPVPEEYVAEYKNNSERGFNGIIGSDGWYIPTFTLDEYPSFNSYTGLQQSGEKLAEVFKRPTIWKAYCDEVSLTNCSIDDGIAKRRPMNEDEETSYFAKDYYIGHFRYTEKNNCSNPEIKCTGHFIDYPCQWTSYFERQAYWNNISLENDIIYDSVGDLTRMRQVFQASKATKSHIITMWWYPEPTLSDGYVRVTLPKASSQCKIERARTFDINDRCTNRITELRSTKVSSCDGSLSSIEKYYAKSLFDMSKNVNKATNNPAYDLLSSFQLRSLDVMEMLEEFASRGENANHYDFRDVVCEWVVQNFDQGSNLMKYVPSGYPLEVVADSDRSVLFVPIIIGSISTFVVFAAVCFACYYRHRAVIQYAQPSFLCILCTGSMAISIAAILYGLEPSAEKCMMREWFELLGHTLVIIPLLVKTSVINAVKQEEKGRANECVWIVVSQKWLHVISGTLLSIFISYLICWTVLDPSTKQETPILLEEGNNAGKVMVQVSCSSSKYLLWKVYPFAFVGFFVVCAVVLNFQSKPFKSLFDEHIHVRIVVYANFLFFALLVIAFIISYQNFNVDPKVHDTVISIFLSLDAVVTVSSYFIPKLWGVYVKKDMTEIPEFVVPAPIGGSTMYSTSTQGHMFALNVATPDERKRMICKQCEQKIKLKR